MQFIYAISPIQSKVARTYLDWTQQDLATAADVGRSTVRSFEDGFSPRRDSVVKIRRTFEKYGIEFVGSDGVKWSIKENVVQANQKTGNICNNILQLTKNDPSDTSRLDRSQDLFTQVCSIWLILNASNTLDNSN